MAASCVGTKIKPRSNNYTIKNNSLTEKKTNDINETVAVRIDNNKQNKNRS